MRCSKVNKDLFKFLFGLSLYIYFVEVHIADKFKDMHWFPEVLIYGFIMFGIRYFSDSIIDLIIDVKQEKTDDVK